MWRLLVIVRFRISSLHCLPKNKICSIIIVPTVLQGCETLYLQLKGRNKSRVRKRELPSKVFVYKRKKREEERKMV